MKKKLALVLTMTLLITGCVKTPKLENGEDLFASVDGKDFSVVDMYNELKNTYGISALMNLVDKYIISQELESTASEELQAKAYIAQMKNYYESNGYTWSQVLASNGYTESSLEEYYIYNYEKESVAKKYYKDNVSEAEINAYYKDEIIGDITAKQILISPKVEENASDEEKEKASKEAYNKALEVIEKLNNGEDFTELAKTYSDDSSASLGGTLAPFNKQSDYPTDFINEAVKLNKDEYSKKPIKTTYGYHILYIVSKDEKPSLESIKDTIISNIANKNMEDNENYQETAFKAIREKYNLNIIDTVVKERYEQVMTQY